jgi:hypothetical protein
MIAMRRRWVLPLALAAIGAMSLGLVLVLAVIFSVRPGITEENYSRITRGMTPAEVQELLGSEGEEQEEVSRWYNQIRGGNNSVRTWHGDRLTVDVSFRDGGVWQKGMMKNGERTGVTEAPPGPFPDRLLDVVRQHLRF